MPDPNAIFKNSWKRIDRAISHAKNLATQWAAVMKGDAYRVVLQDEGNGTWVAEAVFNIPTEHDLALELGEFAYQLRSALDGAVWQAVTILERAEPTTDVNRLEFPISESVEKFKQNSIHKHLFPTELKNWLDSIQIYNAEKPLDHPDRGLEVTLNTLHDLARKDRHRRLRIVAAVPTEINYQIDFEPGGRVTFEEALRCNFLEGERKFLRLGVESLDGTPIDKGILATALKVEIRVDEIPIYPNSDLTEEIKRLINATAHVVERFEKAFKCT
jgi:hypothetical protein